MLFKISSIVALVTLATIAAADPAPVIKIPAFTAFAKTYPPTDAVPPTNTAQVQAWVAAIDMTKVPNVPVVKWNAAAGEPASIAAIPADACDWTTTNCINQDIINCPAKNIWGLTFDDGPTQYSPTLYDYLDTTNTKATLFYIGSRVLQYPKYAHRACAAGHQIAVHTWSHQPSTTLTNEQFIAEIKYTEQAINEVCGLTPVYFRPPYGDIDNRIRGLLVQMGYKTVIWDRDTNDWNMPHVTEAQIDAAFAGWIKAAPTSTVGPICLEHELSNNSVNAAIKNLPAVQATWKTMPISSCMNDAHPYREAVTLATASNPTGAGGSATGSSNKTNTSSGNGTATNGTAAATVPSGAVGTFASQAFMGATVAALAGLVTLML